MVGLEMALLSDDFFASTHDFSELTAAAGGGAWGFFFPTFFSLVFNFSTLSLGFVMGVLCFVALEISAVFRFARLARYLSCVVIWRISDVFVTSTRGRFIIAVVFRWNWGENFGLNFSAFCVWVSVMSNVRSRLRYEIGLIRDGRAAGELLTTVLAAGGGTIFETELLMTESFDLIGCVGVNGCCAGGRFWGVLFIRVSPNNLWALPFTFAGEWSAVEEEFAGGGDI